MYKLETKITRHQDIVLSEINGAPTSVRRSGNGSALVITYGHLHHELWDLMPLIYVFHLIKRHERWTQMWYAKDNTFSPTDNILPPIISHPIQNLPSYRVIIRVLLIFLKRSLVNFFEFVKNSKKSQRKGFGTLTHLWVLRITEI